MSLIQEYLFQNKKGELVFPKRGALLKGRVYKDIRFGIGQIIKTSKVKYVNENLALTRSSMYELGKPAEEYLEFLEKFEEGVPFITNWSLSGNKEEGYIISGKTSIMKKISGRIISQSESCVTLDDGKKYFVQWRAMSKKTKKELDQTGTILDLEQINGGFSKFSYVLCKPNLF